MRGEYGLSRRSELLCDGLPLTRRPLVRRQSGACAGERHSAAAPPAGVYSHTDLRVERGSLRQEGYGLDKAIPEVEMEQKEYLASR